MEKVAPFVVHLDTSTRLRSLLQHSLTLQQQTGTYLFGSTWLPLENSLCRFIVLVRHGAGKGGHSLTVANVETNVWMGNEELYNDIVLVANSSMDGSSAL